MPKLSILIPAKNEEFIGKTIENLLENIEDDTEIIAVLDGYETPIPNIPYDPRLVVVKLPRSIGQRAATNLACKLSKAKYVAKVDAHCSFDKGFDRILLEDMQDDWTVVPTMRNLHAFDWLCPNGHRRYQGPSGVCKECGEPTEKDIIWYGKPNPQSTAYRFDKTMHFQYWPELKARQEGDLVETLSLQGSFFLLTREKYWELDICEETFGSWGQQGTEVACKTWLSGGRVVVNRKTWYAHMFRTQGGDFGFPYEQDNKQVDKARKYSRELFPTDKWPKAVHSFKWLLDKFNPPEWESKGILYYTDNQIPMKIAYPVRKYLKKAGLPITSVTLKPTKLGHNIVLPGERGKLQMFKQILKGLESMSEDIVFFCEHDVIYHKSHFDFTPKEKDKFYYNLNNWRVRLEDGHAVKFDHDSTSQMCAYRELLIKEYQEIVRQMEAGTYKGGYEPGTRDGRSDRWSSELPNIDIRHDNNLTRNRWSPTEFRDKSTCANWTEGNLKDLWYGIRD